MTCEETLRTQAYLDGELDETAAAEAERHIEDCAECQALSMDSALLSDALRKDAARHRAPKALRERIMQSLEDEASPVPLVRKRSFWMGAASGAAVSALAAALAIFAILPPSATTLAQSVTEDHIRALMAGRTIEVASSSHHTVKPWFAGRVEVSPPVADFPQQGFDLAGGRIDKVAGTRAAVVVYRHGLHEIDLFVWPDKGSQLPGEQSRHGYHAIFWKNGDLNYAAVCDMEGPELRKFVNLVRTEPE
jgi:anti-sigma factor RsiW